MMPKIENVNVKSVFCYASQRLPNIRDKSGSADVKIKISKLLAIKWLSEVFRRFGRIFANSGMA